MTSKTPTMNSLTSSEFVSVLTDVANENNITMKNWIFTDAENHADKKAKADFFRGETHIYSLVVYGIDNGDFIYTLDDKVYDSDYILHKFCGNSQLEGLNTMIEDLRKKFKDDEMFEKNNNA